MRALLHVTLCMILAAPLAAGETINVAAAISLKEVVSEAAKGYEAETGHRVEFTFGASGQLLAQIRNGAPIDAFISAADKQADDLERLGMVENGTRRVVAGNALVLVAPADAPPGLSDFKGLADARVKKLAIGEPRTVPAGQYAVQVLQKLEQEAKLAGRLVYGSNVRQVLDYVRRGEVSAGIVYATDAKEAGDKVKVVAVADASSHDPIRYPAVVIKGSKKRDAAARFLDYLTSEKAKQLFRDKGFAPGDQAAGKPAK